MIHYENIGMVDVLTSEQRKYNMSRIRGKNTRPEVELRRVIWAKGFRYRIKNKLPGRPDFIFTNKKIAVFVDGCFWHRCAQHYVSPQTNVGFWENKISDNVARDLRNTKALEKMGWMVIRIWEHDIKNNIDMCVSEIINELEK